MIYSHIIPPKAEEYVITGHCSSVCTNDAVPKEGTNIFNVLLHSHKAGRKLRLRHFRNGTELPWISSDDNFDFDYQQSHPLQEPVKVLAGDHLTTGWFHVEEILYVAVSSGSITFNPYRVYTY
jgi:hypothetical protein